MWRGFAVVVGCCCGWVWIRWVVPKKRKEGKSFDGKNDRDRDGQNANDKPKLITECD